MDDLKWKFIHVSLRYKKLDICSMQTQGTPFTELTLMQSIAGTCPSSCGNLNVTKMKEQLHLSQSAISQALKSLEKKGFITRAIDPSDRRKIEISITDRGNKALKESEACFHHTLDYVISTFGEKNMNQLTELLDHLINIYENMDEL